LRWPLFLCSVTWDKLQYVIPATKHDVYLCLSACVVLCFCFISLNKESHYVELVHEFPYIKLQKCSDALMMCPNRKL
jgi:hypothetical protein